MSARRLGRLTPAALDEEAYHSNDNTSEISDDLGGAKISVNERAAIYAARDSSAWLTGFR
ncbi:MAG: hypothetical protein U0929_12155 [Planctomycetaceae bacterium]